MKTVLVVLIFVYIGPGTVDSRYLKPVKFATQALCEQARDAALEAAPIRGGVIAKCI